MKIIFVILSSLLIGLSLFGQKPPISYVNYEKSKDNSSNSLYIDNRVSKISFTSETEFEFWSYPVPSSCLTWREYTGTWERKNDTIIFYDQYEIKANDTKFSFSTNLRNAFYQLEFKMDNGSDLTHKNINIAFLYDLGSEGWEVEEFEMTLEDDFSLKIPFENIQNINNLATIRFLYYLENGEKRFGFISTDKTLTEKEMELPNVIEVTFIEKPEKEIVKRITKGILIDNGIKIISTHKNKTKLKDETPELIFKEFYKKETEK